MQKVTKRTTIEVKLKLTLIEHLYAKQLIENS